MVHLVHRWYTRVYIGTEADPHCGSTRSSSPAVPGWLAYSGALTMSIEALKPPPTPMRLLDAVPPDTRVVFHNVTWDAYRKPCGSHSASERTAASPLTVRISR